MRVGTTTDRASVGGSWAGGSPAELQRRGYDTSPADTPFSEDLSQFMGERMAARSCAETMDSSDAEQASSAVGGSMTPQAAPLKRRGFLPLLGRTKSGDSNSTMSAANTVVVSKRESEEKLRTVRGRGWSGSGREESEGTAGSDRGSFR